MGLPHLPLPPGDCSGSVRGSAIHFLPFMLALALVHGWLHPPLSESGRKIACVGFNFIFHFYLLHTGPKARASPSEPGQVHTLRPGHIRTGHPLGPQLDCHLACDWNQVKDSQSQDF